MITKRRNPTHFTHATSQRRRWGFLVLILLLRDYPDDLGHAESYNPPEEYLFDEEEKLAWEALDEEDRPFKFLPTKYSLSPLNHSLINRNKSLRTTPAYQHFQRERFERCLDLYMAVRSQRKKVFLSLARSDSHWCRETSTWILSHPNFRNQPNFVPSLLFPP